MTEPTRKLAAIVFTDIVGFTSITAKSQAKASKLLKVQRETLKPIVEKYKGIWIKEMGDGLLLIFDTVTDAVKCSIKIQEGAKSIEVLKLRIGIHEGEILLENDDVIGDDVNITSRLEPFAAPGGIAISNKVNDTLIREDEFKTKLIGKPKLKGVGQKVEVYCITSHGLPETNIKEVSAKLELDPKPGIKWNIFNLTGAALTLVGVLFWINISFLGIGIASEEEIPSIAIIPFDNKGSEEEDYFAWSISTDLMAELSSRGMIRVASYNDIEKIDYNNIDNSKLAKMLSIRYVAQGAIWKINDVFQLSLEIYDSFKSKVLWSGKWQSDNLVKIKNEISKKVFNKLSVNKNHIEQNIYIVDPIAYEYYLRAKYKFENYFESKDRNFIRGLLEKALEIDTNFVKASNLLAHTYSTNLENSKAIELFLDNIKRADKINAFNEKAYALQRIGVIYRNNDNYKIAAEYFNRALKIQIMYDDISGQANTLLSLGKLQYKNDDRKGAHNSFMNSLELSKQSNDLINTISAYLELSNIHRRHFNLAFYDTTKASDYLFKAYDIADSLENNKQIIRCLYEMVSTSKNDSLFIKYHQQILSLAKSSNDQKSMFNSLLALSSINAKNGEIEKAREYTSQAVDIAYKSNQWELMAESFIYGPFYESDDILFYTALINKLYDLSLVNNSKEWLSFLLKEKSVICDRKDLVNRKKYLIKSLNIADEIENKYLQNEIINQLIVLNNYFLQSKNNISLKHINSWEKYMKRSINLMLDMGKHRKALISINRAGKYYEEMGRYIDARNFYENGLSLATERGLLKYIKSFKYELSKINFKETGKIKLSKDLALDCFNYNPRNKDTLKILPFLGILSYFDKDYKRSMEFYNKVLERDKGVSSYNYYTDMFVFYFASKNKLGETISYYDIVNYFENNLHESGHQIYESMFNLYGIYLIFGKEEHLKLLKENLLFKIERYSMTDLQKKNYLNSYWAKLIMNN